MERLQLWKAGEGGLFRKQARSLSTGVRNTPKVREGTSVLVDFCLLYECAGEMRRGDGRIFTLTTSGVRLRPPETRKPQQVLGGFTATLSHRNLVFPTRRH